MRDKLQQTGIGTISRHLAIERRDILSCGLQLPVGWIADAACLDIESSAKRFDKVVCTLELAVGDGTFPALGDDADADKSGPAVEGVLLFPLPAVLYLAVCCSFAVAYDKMEVVLTGLGQLFSAARTGFAVKNLNSFPACGSAGYGTQCNLLDWIQPQIAGQAVSSRQRDMIIESH